MIILKRNYQTTQLKPILWYNVRIGYCDTIMFSIDTFTVPQEISLEEMQKQALYISQNTLGGLQEIGEGTMS